MAKNVAYSIKIAIVGIYFLSFSKSVSATHFKAVYLVFIISNGLQLSSQVIWECLISYVMRMNTANISSFSFFQLNTLVCSISTCRADNFVTSSLPLLLISTFWGLDFWLSFCFNKKRLSNFSRPTALSLVCVSHDGALFFHSSKIPGTVNKGLVGMITPLTCHQIYNILCLVLVLKFEEWSP